MGGGLRRRAATSRHLKYRTPRGLGVDLPTLGQLQNTAGFGRFPDRTLGLVLLAARPVAPTAPDQQALNGFSEALWLQLALVTQAGDDTKNEALAARLGARSDRGRPIRHAVMWNAIGRGRDTIAAKAVCPVTCFNPPLHLGVYVFKRALSLHGALTRSTPCFTPAFLNKLHRQILQSRQGEVLQYARESGQRRYMRSEMLVIAGI